MKNLILILSVLFSISSFAKMIPLIKITNDFETEIYYNFLLETDERGDILKFYKDIFKNNKFSQRLTYDLKSTSIENGFVLDVRVSKGMSYDTAKVTSKNFSPHNGGDIDLIYLYNAMAMNHRIYPMKLERNGSGWSLYNQYNKRISSLFFKTNKIPVIGPVGIAEIIPTW